MGIWLDLLQAPIPRTALESGQVHLNRAPVDVASLVRRVVEAIQPLLGQRQVR